MYWHTLDVFKLLISSIFDDNMVIGGMTALQMHGLETRHCTDVDIIIYQPTPKQKEALKLLSTFDLIANRPDDGYPAKAHKFKKKEVYLDIIVEDQPMPPNLLYIEIGSFIWPVQSIRNVIQAKRSYFFNKKDAQGLNKYIRAKDALDMLELKNLNFNLSTLSGAGIAGNTFQQATGRADDVKGYGENAF